MVPECLERALAALLAFGAFEIIQNDYIAFLCESKGKFESFLVQKRRAA